MRTNEAGVRLIKQFEGFSPKPYKCPGGVLTIGFGHAIRQGELFTEIDEFEGHQLLLRDLKEAEAAIARHVTAPLNENQFSALASWVFNLGAERLRKSTLLRLLNKSRHQDAAAEFPKWSYAGGIRLNGLKARRLAERKLFETPV